MKLAPVIVFAYNRPELLRQALESLQANEGAAESDLFIFIDGPKPGASDEQKRRINEVKAVAAERTWCRKTQIIASETNKGLALSISEGITKIINEFGRAIIVEDDVMTSPFFLRFMNESLQAFENESKVLSIGSWNYFTRSGGKENFFLTMPDTIAWATWKRAWDLFDFDPARLHSALKKKKLLKKFNLDGRYNFEQMLLEQVHGASTSWAIRWTAVATLHGTLTYYPGVPLSKHIGWGNDSTNCSGEDFNAHVQLSQQPLMRIPLKIELSRQAERDWVHFEKEIKGSGAVMDQRLLSGKKLRDLASGIKKRFF